MTLNKIILILFVSFSYSLVWGVSTELDSIEARLRSDVKYLASDELKGRFPGTEGIEKAAKYIEKKFINFGLDPYRGSYRQNLEVTVGKDMGDGNKVVFNSIVKKPGVPIEYATKFQRKWTINKDYRPMALSENGTVEGEIAFVGYGITAKELEYDDYEGIDVKEKIVVIITETPSGTTDMKTMRQKKEKEDEFENYSSNRYKISNAKRHGAKGIIFVRTEGDSMNVFFPLSFSQLGMNTGAVIIQANRHSLDKFFPENKKLFDLEKKIRKNKKPQSIEIPHATVSIKVDLKDRKKTTSNIVGVIEGTDTDLKNEYVIVGAHYDHLGMGGPNSRYQGKKPKVHNGADDNASGTAGLIELARHFSKKPGKRSLIFVAFTAEEMGTIGSKYFVDNTADVILNAEAMYNMDMIGRLNKTDRELTLFGYKSSVQFKDIFASLADSTIQYNFSGGSFGASDHAPFLRDSIPSIHFFSGIHGKYHTPEDDWNYLNYDGMALVVKSIENIVKKSLDHKGIEFNLAILEKSQKPDRRNGHGYAKVWFGIVPSFEDSELGFKIAGTSPGSPAQSAGLQKDDIIVKMNEANISNVYDFMYKLREHKPGDVLDVTVLRGKDLKKTHLEVKLAPRSK